MLPYVNCRDLIDCQTACGEPNLENKAKGITYHASTGAMKEAEEWFSSLELNQIPLLCVYGVGLGYYYDAIVGWLRENRKRRLIFLEDDLASSCTCLQDAFFKTGSRKFDLKDIASHSKWIF